MEKIAVAIDGSACSNRALDAAINWAKLSDSQMVLIHVIEWSAFSFNTAEELAERHGRREKELDRARQTLLKPIEEKLVAEGIEPEFVVRHGHPAETIADIAKKDGLSSIFVGRKGQSKMKSMLFGSMVGSLVQIASVPVTVVP